MQEMKVGRKESGLFKGWHLEKMEGLNFHILCWTQWCKWLLCGGKGGARKTGYVLSRVFAIQGTWLLFPAPWIIAVDLRPWASSCSSPLKAGAQRQSRSSINAKAINVLGFNVLAISMGLVYSEKIGEGCEQRERKQRTPPEEHCRSTCHVSRNLDTEELVDLKETRTSRQGLLGRVHLRLPPRNPAGEEPLRLASYGGWKSLDAPPEEDASCSSADPTCTCADEDLILPRPSIPTPQLTPLRQPGERPHSTSCGSGVGADSGERNRAGRSHVHTVSGIVQENVHNNKPVALVIWGEGNWSVR